LWRRRRAVTLCAMKLKGWRKIAGAMWGPPDDPQVYGMLEFDSSPLLAYMARARAAGHRVTPTHFVGRAIACALHEVPDFNVRIRGSKVIPRETVDVFFIAAVEGGRELSGVKVERADEKSVLAVAAELHQRATAMKQGDDPDFARTKRSISAMPRMLLRPAMRLSSWVAGDLNRDLKILGAKANPFGSAMVTSIGMLGIPQGFAPLARVYKMPLLVLVGEIVDKPWAVDRRAEVRPILSLTATIDHRYADGWHISQLIRPFRRYLEDPAAFEPELPPAGPTESEEAREGEREAKADQAAGSLTAEDREPVA
jgi:pyruvate/2-oxoglutarate dehydrogenase complex dihydrolipoamide acyltransferase (E2) component